jgi:hypothetical protein
MGMITLQFFHQTTEWLERASWICQIVLTIVAVVTAVFAAVQLWIGTRIYQATLLLELDARWDSQELRDARKLFAKMGEDITKIVSNANPLANDGAKEALLRAEWTKVLRDMRTQSEAEYLKLIGWCGFFETVGLMVKRRYISRSDIIDLFEGPLVDLDRTFRNHFEEREKEMGVPAGLFEHALLLSKSALKN